MNTNNLSIYRIPTEHEAWFKFRTVGITDEDAALFKCESYNGGVGASESAGLLGLQKKYRPCPQEIYAFKAGISSPTQQTNRAMVRGKILEPIAAQIWKLFDGDVDSWTIGIMDYMTGDRETKKQLSVRNCRNLSGYYVNKNYPWLFSSLDYFAEKNTPGLMDGKIHPDGFPIEVKTINSYYAKLWEAGVPPAFVCQLNQEMICTNSDYGEIACLFPDEFRFEIFPFYRDDELCARIVHWTEIFWNKVLEARESVKLRDKFFKEGKMNEGEHQQAIIDSNEPEPDDSEAYNEYIREQYKQVIPTIPGDMALFNECTQYLTANMYSDMLESKKVYVKNKLMKLLESSGAAEISFDALGKVTYAADKNGKRTLRVATKIVPPKSQVENEFNKLNFKLI